MLYGIRYDIPQGKYIIGKVEDPDEMNQYEMILESIEDAREAIKEKETSRQMKITSKIMTLKNGKMVEVDKTELPPEILAIIKHISKKLKGE